MAFYAFDATGLASDNKITNEDHTVTSVHASKNNYFVPVSAPFYAPSLVLVDKATGKTLDEGVDYKLTHKFQEGKDNTALDLYGSVTLMDVSRTGTFSINYQTLGGDFVDASTQALADGLEHLSALLIVDWHQLANVPDTFPATPHNTSVTSIDAVNEIITSMNRIADNLELQFSGIKFSDISDLDTEWRAPLLKAFGDVAAAITAKAQASEIPFEQSCPGQTSTLLGSMVDGEWKDTALSCTPTSDGTYMIHKEVNAVAINPTTPDYTIESRWVVNGAVIDRSYANHIALGLDTTMAVRLQVRIVGTNATNLSIANTTYTSSLSIMKMGV